MMNISCKRTDESMLENNERILKRTFWTHQSDSNLSTLAKRFSKLGIRISHAKIDEKIKRDGVLVGYIVHIEDTTGGVYYLDSDSYFAKYSVYESSRDGTPIYINGADTDFPED